MIEVAKRMLRLRTQTSKDLLALLMFSATDREVMRSPFHQYSYLRPFPPSLNGLGPTSDVSMSEP